MLLEVSAAVAVLCLCASVAPLAVRLWSILGPVRPRRPNALRFGLLGLAGVTRFSIMYPSRRTGIAYVQCVASRDKRKAAAFARQWRVPTAHDNLSDVLNDSAIDAVYISLPTNMHFEWALRALEAGKSVLVEKPMAMSTEQISQLEAKAKLKGVTLMEAMHYRYHPVAKRLKDLVQSKQVGEIKRVEARFIKFDPQSMRSTSSQIQSIKMLDRYIYLVDVIRLISEPKSCLKMLAAKRLGYKVDATFELENGAPVSLVADSSTFWAAPAWDIVVHGTEGTLFVKNFGFPFLYHRIQITSHERGGPSRCEKHYCTSGASTFELQLEAFVDAVQAKGQVLTDARNARENIRLVEKMKVL